jgi:alpha/beta superfamily hydrolase
VSRPVRLRSTDGLALEGRLDAPDDMRAGAVFCHPHPEMGGTMSAPLLLAVSEELRRRRWAVLRFNFRGIGSSEGRPGGGEAEVADALGAAAFLEGELGSLPRAIAGWSFGGAVAVRAAAANDAFVGCAAIAPSVTPKAGVTAGLPPARDLDLGVPLLFVCAANDDVVPAADCRAWLAPVEAATYVEIPGANHFFWGRYERLATTVADWLDERV